MSKSEFHFKDVDKTGQKTLEVIRDARAFNRWMYETIRPHCQGRILEIGSGIGNISEFFIVDGARITLSDIRRNYCQQLRERFSGQGNVEGIIEINLTGDHFEEVYRPLLAQFDTVFALNVLEHIEEDRLALANVARLLRPGGQAVILVPAYGWLYNQLDRSLEHYRRYTRGSLVGVFVASDYTVVHSQYFNLAGLPGWFVSGRLQRHESIPGGQMKLYNALVPLFRLVDRLVCNSAGLSVIVVGRR